jgi:uncharacterized protein YaaN involved in tellurite resistance
MSEGKDMADELESTGKPSPESTPGREVEPLTGQVVDADASGPAVAVPAAGVQLTPQEQARVEQLRRSFDLTDAREALQYGLPAQTKIAAFADQLLGDLRNKDADEAREALASLLARIRELDVDSLAKGQTGSRLPIVGRFVDGMKRFESRYERLSGSIEKVLNGLERTRMGLLKDITVLDKLYDLNLDHLHDLDLYIAAGDQIMADVRAQHLPALEAEAERTGDPLAGQRLADLRQSLTRFERRLHDLKLTRMIAIQTAPQIRLIQGNDQSLVEKIQSSITSTVPLWKNQIAIALSLYRQQQALALQREVSDASNELLSRNAELLRSGSAKVAQETERGLVDIETLRKVNDDLIATIEESLQIQQEGHERRLQAEGELLRLQADLRQRLIELK